MPFTKRVSVIMPFDQWLSANQNTLKWGIVDEIEALGYHTEIFFDPRGKPSLAAAKAWSASEADRVTRRCVGAVLIGLPRWSFPTAQGAVNLPTEFCYYEGAIAYTLRLPILVLVQENVVRRVVFDNGYGGYVGGFPDGGDRQVAEAVSPGRCRRYRARLEDRLRTGLQHPGADRGSCLQM